MYIQQTTSKNTKVKKHHPYHPHHVNESLLLITVYPFPLVMFFVISVCSLYANQSHKLITTYSNSSTMPRCHSCTASYIRNTFYIITKQHALEHKVTLFMLL